MYQCQLRYIFDSVISLTPPLPFTADDALVEVLNSFPEFSNLSTSSIKDGLEDPLGALGLATKRQPQVLVWIDTLRIPPMPQDPGASELIAAKLGISNLTAHLSGPKAKAIDSMAQLYAAAEKVLVLDPELRHIPSNAVTWKDVLASHIRICPWMSRSWPF